MERAKLKTVLLGAGIALAAGLLMGAAAKPDLAADDRPEGPQIMAGWPGARSTGPFDDGATFASYKGQLPDYVLGTDWKKSLAPPPLPREPREERLARNDDAPLPEVVEFTHAAYDEPAHPAPSYPSVQGGEAPPAAEPAPADPGFAG